MEQNCQLPRNSNGRLLPGIRSPIGEWMNGLEARAPKNVLIVATLQAGSHCLGGM